MNENILGEEFQENAIREAQQDSPENSDQSASSEETGRLKQQNEELKDKYLRLVADFDNFRKRNARERVELIQNASQDLITALLPVLDDSERAQKELPKAQDIEAVKEGIDLVFNKLKNSLTAKGLKPMESIGKDFNPEFHEAITEIPAPSEEMKGKVIDEVEKGYYLNDKIIRFAKVVVGK